MRISQTSPEHAPTKAEGNAGKLPYDTELASSAGVHVHFWVSDEVKAKGADEVTAALCESLRLMRGARDVVSASFSYGSPEKYWAHQDVWAGQHTDKPNPNPSA